VQYVSKLVKEGKTMREALQSFQDIAGKESQWGVMVIDNKTPDIIYTSTMGSPILVGFNYQEDQIFVVS
jgi:glucosamine 6-phosphate synthetase-like amidotransferase/phosphosugar isomerase protein